MAVEKNTFIEIEYTGKTEDGEIFDSTRKDDEKIMGVNEGTFKPLKLAVGNEMIVKGLDEDFIGKEIGKDYSVKVSPEKAFGKRDPKLVQMVSMSNFNEQKVVPQKGMQFSFDGKLAKIVSVSGGRVLVDFNHSLAGKNLIYSYKILRKVEDKKEQLDSLQEFFFRQKFDSEINGNTAKIKIEKKFLPIFELMKQRFEEIISLKIEFETVSDKK